MPDRVIRDELLDSDRWLGLGHDTERLAFICLLLRCDDFGNLEGGLPRIWRFLCAVTQIKTKEHAAAILEHLSDADLIRMYAVDNRELIHIPRLRPHRQYLVRRVPPSPWCDLSTALGKHKRIYHKGLASNVATTSHTRSNMVAQGVGVGVGENLRGTAVPVDNFSAHQQKPNGNKLPNSKPKPEAPNGPWWTTGEGLADKANEVGVRIHQGQTFKEAKELVMAHLHVGQRPPTNGNPK